MPRTRAGSRDAVAGGRGESDKRAGEQRKDRAGEEGEGSYAQPEARIEQRGEDAAAQNDRHVPEAITQAAPAAREGAKAETQEPGKSPLPPVPDHLVVLLVGAVEEVGWERDQQHGGERDDRAYEERHRSREHRRRRGQAAGKR